MRGAEIRAAVLRIVRGRPDPGAGAGPRGAAGDARIEQLFQLRRSRRKIRPVGLGARRLRGIFFRLLRALLVRRAPGFGFAPALGIGRSVFRPPGVLVTIVVGMHRPQYGRSSPAREGRRPLDTRAFPSPRKAGRGWRGERSEAEPGEGQSPLDSSPSPGSSLRSGPPSPRLAGRGEARVAGSNLTLNHCSAGAVRNSSAKCARSDAATSETAQ